MPKSSAKSPMSSIGVHTVERALAVGSVDQIITAQGLRPYIVDALDRGMSKV